MTNGTLAHRDIKIDLSFLKEKRAYHMTSFEDGPNANYVAMDYRKRKSEVSKDQTLTIGLARNGGWAAVIE